MEMSRFGVETHISVLKAVFEKYNEDENALWLPDNRGYWTELLVPFPLSETIFEKRHWGGLPVGRNPARTDFPHHETRDDHPIIDLNKRRICNLTHHYGFLRRTYSLNK